jgi:hypothetical protein
MKWLILPLGLLALASCSGEKAKQAEPEPKIETAKPAIDEDVRAEKKSIEEAADAAAKLVEEETRQEIEAYKGENTSQ